MKRPALRLRMRTMMLYVAIAALLTWAGVDAQADNRRHAALRRQRGPDSTAPLRPVGNHQAGWPEEVRPGGRGDAANLPTGRPGPSPAGGIRDGRDAASGPGPRLRSSQ